MMKFEPLQESAFDLRARAELALGFDPGQPPKHLFRHTRLLSGRGAQRSVVALLLAASAVGAVFAMRPPALVRDAIEHEYYERTLRGTFMQSGPLLASLGLGLHQPLPGDPQLMRPCQIDGRLAYHLTTFLEKGGMVTVFAFDQPVSLKAGSGWWNSIYWQVIDSRQGRPLVLVAQRKNALTVAHNQLSKPTEPPTQIHDPADSSVFK